MKDYKKLISSEIDQAKSFGHKLTSSGASLNGNIPDVAPNAWFHVIFPGLTKNQINTIQEK